MAVIIRIHVVYDMYLSMKYRLEFNKSRHKLNELLIVKYNQVLCTYA